MKIIRRYISYGFVANLLLCANAHAGESCERVSEEAILKEWRKYSSQAGEKRDEPDYHTAMITSPAAVVNFTKRSHPAYPTLIIRSAVEKDDGVYLSTEAITGAECNKFFDLMEQYKNLDKQIQNNIGN